MDTAQLTLWASESSAGAVIVGNYRYTLWRQWDPALPRALFIMLNPSVANGIDADPTLRRCLAFARSWGMGSIEIVNLFAYISPYPEVLKQVEDAIGAENDRYIQRAIARTSLIVCAWGAFKQIERRDREVLRLLDGREAHCLRLTKEKCPYHPLYVPGDTQLIRYPEQKARGI
jgi:hypothetical protein